MCRIFRGSVTFHFPYFKYHSLFLHNIVSAPWTMSLKSMNNIHVYRHGIIKTVLIFIFFGITEHTQTQPPSHYHVIFMGNQETSKEENSNHWVYIGESRSLQRLADVRDQ